MGASRLAKGYLRVVSGMTGIGTMAPLSVSAQVALTRLIKSRRAVPGAPGASRDLLASPWGQARPHLGIIQPEVLLKPAGRPHLGQPG